MFVSCRFEGRRKRINNNKRITNEPTCIVSHSRAENKKADMITRGLACGTLDPLI
jgi:hypothetical protein